MFPLHTLRRLSGLAVVIGVATLAVPPNPALASHDHQTTIVSNNSVSDSVPQKSASVGCPSDMVVVGAGAEIGYTTDEVHITGIMPNRTGGSVSAYASEDDDGYLYNWRLTVTAVCASAPPGYEVVSEYHVATSDPSVAQVASCPSGKVLLGGGFDIHINNSGWQVPRNIPDVVANQLFSDAISDSFIVWAHEDEDGTSQLWVLTAYAICALPIPGMETVYSADGYYRDDRQSEIAVCPPDKHLLGVGGAVFPTTGEVSFLSIKPGRYNGEDYVIVKAAEDQNGISEDIYQYQGRWRLDAWVICAPTVTRPFPSIEPPIPPVAG